MTGDQLAAVRAWFDDYVLRFKGAGGDLDPALRIKVDHSERVAVEARDLAQDLGWARSGIHAAEALGLLHDIGRFSQFAEYGTFSDRLSVDHGERGWSVLVGSPILSDLEHDEREAILDAVRYHNRRAIPADVPLQSLPFLKLIRDADKLDIFAVVLDAVEKDGFRDLPEMMPGITLEKSCSAQVLEEVSRRRICSLENVRSVGDFLLLQLSWVHDLNYAPTLRRLADRDVFPRLLCHLEGNHGIQAIGADLRRFVAERLRPEEQACPSTLMSSKSE